MPSNPPSVPTWPCYELTAAADGTVTVSGPAAHPGPYNGREDAITAVAALAADLTPPRPVRADAVDADGTVWPLHIDPDGTVREAGPARRPRKRRTARAGSPRRRFRGRTPAPTPEPPALASPPAAQLPQPAEPFVIPTVPTAEDEPTVRVHTRRTAPADEPTTRVRVKPAPPADEPTTRVRASKPAAPIAEQHERPAEDPRTALQPVPSPSIPVPTPAPAPATPTVQAAPQQGRAPIPSFLRIRNLEQDGKLAEAAQMAAALDEAATASHGISHPAALQAREVHAHLTAQLGDFPGAVALYRDVAERWTFQGRTEPAEEAAGRAHALWLQITDHGQAIAAGEAIVRMRANIPGPDGIAYRKAVMHLSHIRATATPQPGTPG